jgi:hypothetical protein
MASEECYTSELQEVADGHDRIAIIESDALGGIPAALWSWFVTRVAPHILWWSGAGTGAGYK